MPSMSRTAASTGKTAEPVIRIEELVKEYPMGDSAVRALRGISFTVAPGEYVAIMGSSGSGKSTLLNILGCLDVPTAGAYHLEGRDVAHFNDDELSALRREKFGFIFQSFNLIARNTVLENIEVPLFYQGWHERRSRERARELAEMVGLGDRVRHRPAELSGGQRQRAAIARALANDPSVILADEPTGNLDSRTGAEIMAVLDSLVAEGRTIILVTHEDEIAAHAHRIIRLSDGMIESDRRIDRGES
jgi:putative ABC transport system ATP-binding protein